MSVICLMYHHTPDGAAEGFYDVALTTFKDQIRALLDAGVPFVKFTDSNRAESLRGRTGVALTFDDGHASNAAAFGFLADCGLTPMAFIVRDWSRNDRRYLSAAALADVKSVCELGGHGATHRALPSLSDADLADELAGSRDYLEALTGAPVSAMALPGGHGGPREIAAAERAGFRLVGNSRALPHARASVSVNRICLNRTHDAQAALRLVEAGRLRWTARAARLAATATARRVLGGGLYGALTALAK